MMVFVGYSVLNPKNPDFEFDFEAVIPQPVKVSASWWIM